MYEINNDSLTHYYIYLFSILDKCTIGLSDVRFNELQSSYSGVRLIEQ